MNIFLSAHYDDAILSCGELMQELPDVLVLTVYGGMPKNTGLTDYDKKCGFKSSRQAVQIRRQENTEACELLNVQCAKLDFLDNQYGDNDELKMLEQLRGYTDGHFVYAPIGILHHDHVQLNRLARKLDIVTYYEDIPHRVIWSDIMQDKIRSMQLMEVIMPAGDRQLKRKALERYESQMNKDDLQMEWCLSPERYWR